MDIFKKLAKRDRNPSISSSSMLSDPKVEGSPPFPEPTLELDESRINELFEDLLDKMGFEEDKRMSMRLMNADYKLKMINSQIQNEKHKTDPKADKNTPEYYAKSIQNSKHPNYKILASLRVSLTNQPLSWVQSFIKLGGLVSLVSILEFLNGTKLRKTETILMEVEVIKSIKSLINNKHGIKDACENSRLFNAIAMSTDSVNLTSRRLSLELLSVFCYLEPPNGHNAVLKAMDGLKDQKGDERRFQTICKNFEEYCGRHDTGTEKEVMEFLIANMIFVNAVISVPEDLELRLHLANQFFTCGLNNIFSKIKPSGSYLLNKQFEIFENEMEANYEELTENNNNIKSTANDPLEIFQYLLGTVEGSPSFPFFVSCLKNLMLIRNPAEIRAKYWQLIDQVLAQIMLDGKGIDPDFTGLYRLNVNKIIDGHSKLDRLEKAEETAKSTQEKLQNLQKQKNDLEVEYKSSAVKLEELKKKYDQLEQERASANQLLSPVSMDDEGAGRSRRQTGQDAKAPLTPTNAGVPPPPPPSGGPGLPPPPPPPGSEMGAPSGGPPPPPGAPGLFAKPKLKPKKQYSPQVKLKQVQWEKIPEMAVENTVWKSVNDESWEDRVDFKEIEQLFAAKSANVTIKTITEESKKSEITVINSKKSYGITIMLGRLKHSFYEIRKAVLQMDTGILTDTMVKQFLQFVPTAEEIGQLSIYKDDPSNLAKAESFLVEMIKIYRYEPRLRAMLFKYSYSERYTNVVQEVDSVINSVRSIKNSAALQKLLEVILLIGNYMNSNSFKAKAYGFKITNINKLVDTKSSDNKKTLLHYVAGFVEEKHPEILRFCEDIKSVSVACRGSIFL